VALEMLQSGEFPLTSMTDKCLYGGPVIFHDLEASKLWLVDRETTFGEGGHVEVILSDVVKHA
jgi:hypothetical protein